MDTAVTWHTQTKKFLPKNIFPPPPRPPQKKNFLYLTKKQTLLSKKFLYLPKKQNFQPKAFFLSKEKRSDTYPQKTFFFLMTKFLIHT